MKSHYAHSSQTKYQQTFYPHHSTIFMAIKVDLEVWKLEIKESQVKKQRRLQRDRIRDEVPTIISTDLGMKGEY